MITPTLLPASRRTVLSLAAHATLLCAALMIAFGPLTPPGGAVTSTAKPLSEVEPRTAINSTNTPGDADSLFKITAPGSYYLTGNVTGVAGKHGVEIASGGVTLDLNGFHLLGGAGSLDGVTATLVTTQACIHVRNGTIRGWGGDGLDLSTASCLTVTVENVQAFSNTGNGIAVFVNASITSCISAFNGSVGIRANAAASISCCSTFDNSSNGIMAGFGSSVHTCTSYANNGIGYTLDGGTITACSASANLSGGIDAANGAYITECQAFSNVLDGIRVGTLCTARANSCTNNGDGGNGANIHATGSDNRIEENNCAVGDRGIDVDGAGNVIFRNSCSGHGVDWDIAANNIFGPIIDRRVPGSAAVSGFTAPDASGSTHPNANFSY